MKQILLLLVLLIAAIIANFVISNNKAKKSTAPVMSLTTVTIDGHVFQTQVATTEAQKEIGLSQTTNLPQDQGMLFPFGVPAYEHFWMKNMHIPIDIIFITGNKIVTIFPNVPVPPDPSSPNIPQYQPTQPADTVLEINAGLSNQYNFKIGDPVLITNPTP